MALSQHMLDTAARIRAERAARGMPSSLTAEQREDALNKSDLSERSKAAIRERLAVNEGGARAIVYGLWCRQHGF